MPADHPGIGPPQKRQTLGETLFPKETIEHNYHGGTPMFFARVWETQITIEIGDLIFLLKRSPHDSEVEYVAFCIEKVFEGLLDPTLIERIGQWLPVGSQRADWVRFTKETRESIGKLALEVFFETILDQDKKSFWKYLSRPENLEFGPKVLSLPAVIYPTSLCVFLNYLACCNENTKHAHRGSIRKFLKSVCDEPLEVDSIKMGISRWTKEAREKLAFALVANGMYEECLDYNIPEAYHTLVLKFLGWRNDAEDGLMRFDATHVYSPQQAMQKACEDKEWGHILGVLIRLALKHNHAKFTKTFDLLGERVELRSSGSPHTVESVNTRLAILWNDPVTIVGL